MAIRIFGKYGTADTEAELLDSPVILDAVVFCFDTEHTFKGGTDTWEAYDNQGIQSGQSVVSFESVNQNINSWDATYNYTLGDLISIIYVSPTGVETITKTFNYSGGNLTSIVLSGDTPSGIELTKTFTYTGGNLTDITYT